MSELYESYIAQRELDKENILKENALLESQSREYDRLNKSITDIKDNRDRQIARFSNFKCTVKNALLSEALFKIFEPTLGDDYSKSAKILAENLICDYVTENGGADSILASKRGTSYAIEMLYNNIEDYYKILIEKADKEDPKIEKDDMEEFLDKLDEDSDIENVSQAIALRVANAEEEFINNNLSDKITIKGIMDDTAARINAAKSDDSLDMTDEEIEQEANIMYRQQLVETKNRPKSLLEYMVHNLSKKAMKSDSAKKYFNMRDRLNIDSIVESAKCIYGVLEMVNTLKLENVNERYIKNMFEEE